MKRCNNRSVCPQFDLSPVPFSVSILVTRPTTPLASRDSFHHRRTRGADRDRPRPGGQRKATPRTYQSRIAKEPSHCCARAAALPGIAAEYCTYVIHASRKSKRRFRSRWYQSVNRGENARKGAKARRVQASAGRERWLPHRPGAFAPSREIQSESLCDTSDFDCYARQGTGFRAFSQIRLPFMAIHSRWWLLRGMPTSLLRPEVLLRPFLSLSARLRRRGRILRRGRVWRRISSTSSAG